MPTLTHKTEKELARLTVRIARPAILSREHREWCEAWAMEHYGVPYEQLRRAPLESLEPQLSAYLASVCPPKPQLRGKTEIIDTADI